MVVNRYQFDKIITQTKKAIDPIKRGEEDGIYFEHLAMIEIRMCQFHQKYNLSGRQAKEILQIVLFDVKSMLDQENYDCSKFEEYGYRDCIENIEELFLPDKNISLKQSLKEGIVLDEKYFELPRKVLIRIHESIEQWTDFNGPYGYFHFIGNYLDSEIRTDKKFLVEDGYLK